MPSAIRPVTSWKHLRWRLLSIPKRNPVLSPFPSHTPSQVGNLQIEGNCPFSLKKKIFFQLKKILATPQGMWYLSSWSGIKQKPLASSMRSLNHWTAREVPRLSFFITWRLEEWQSHREVPDSPQHRDRRGQMLVKGLGWHQYFCKAAKYFWGERENISDPMRVGTERSAEKNRPVYWPASFPEDSCHESNSKNIKSPLRFPEVPRKTVVWCLSSSLHSLTYSRRQKQKLGWCHWFGQFTVRLTRKILPYCAPSVSTSSAWTGPKSSTEFCVLSICPPSCPVSLM